MYFWDDHAARPGWQNMAIDRAMLELATSSRTSLFRLYRWDVDTISFGANEAANRHWNRPLIETAGVPVVRRPTGGRAVWHSAADLTYATVVPVNGLPAARGVYAAVHARLLKAVGRVGLTGTLAPTPPREPGLSAGSCFDMAAGGEVVVADRKTIGSAQLVLRDTLLQHGEIARAPRRAMLAPYALTPGTMGPPDAPGTLPPVAMLAAAIQSEWLAADATMAPEQLVAEVLALASDMGAPFRDPNWSWRR